MSKICCFTGHRNFSQETAQEIISRLEDTLINLIENEDFSDFRAGGAIGFDSFAALTVLKLKKKYTHIKLHLVLPCKDQDKYFSKMEKEIYHFVLNNADSVTYIQENYSEGVMFARNRALVDGVDLCIAYLSMLEGGTYQTVTYAKRKKIRTINILKA